MAQQIAVSLARTNFDIHGKFVALSKQMDVGAPGARRRAGRSSARRALVGDACILQRKLKHWSIYWVKTWGTKVAKKRLRHHPL